MKMTESEAYRGRGAWPTKGTGGTIKRTTVKRVPVYKPGPYYMLSDNDANRVGLRPFLLQYAGQKVDLNEMAVYHGVLGIQALLVGRGLECPMNGVFTSETDIAVRLAQKQLGLTAAGIVGKNTMRALLLPLIKRTAAEASGQDWHAVYGILANEGAFDPGAVGVLDPNDVGLAQINLPSHPNVSFSDAFCPSTAVKFVAGLIAQGLSVFHDERDAVASYNLGVGGTKMWINAGRPESWTPPWDTTGRARNVRTYIDRILTQADKDGVK